MYRLPINFHNRLQRGEIPISYIVITTHMGDRIYAEKEISVQNTALEQSGRVLTFGSFERTLQSQKDNILAAYSGKQIQHISLEMDNSDRYFAQLISKEPFIGRPIKYYVGFEDDSQADHISILSGIITEMSVLKTLTIEADEK